MAQKVIDAVFLGFLNHTVEVKRPTTALDGLGGETRSYNTHIPALKCHIQPLPIAQRELAKMRMWIPAGTDVQERDRVIHLGKTYEVVFVGEPAGQAHHLIADLIELSGTT